MLAPPPDQGSSSSGDVSGEGRTKYLQTLESKLGRLQGTDKRRLKSKDILNALTEARDDHLSQPTFDPTPATINVTHTDTNAINDPWMTTDNERDTTDWASVGNELNDIEHDDRKEREMTLEFDELGEDEEYSETRCWPCSKNRLRYDRTRTRLVRSSLTPEEESAFLLHCDHLSKT